MTRLSIFMLPFICAACSTVNASIDGQYDGPRGATMTLVQTRYQFCNKGCTSGLMEVRPLGKGVGRVTFYGVPVTAYFRSTQRGAGRTSLRTWSDGVETGYRVEPSGGVSIDIDPSRGAYFKRRV